MISLCRQRRLLIYTLIAYLSFLSLSVQAQDQKQQIIPNFKGIGAFPDLHFSLSLDHNGPRSLHGQLSTLLEGSMLQILDPRYDLELAIDLMLFRYAGIEDMNPYARGPNIDARKLKIIELYVGESFEQRGAGGTPNPLFWAAVGLDHTYQKIRRKFYTDILLQTKGAQLFNNPIRYIADKHKFHFSFVKLDKDLLKGMIAVAKQVKDPVKIKQMWLRYMALIENSVGIRSLHMDSETSLTAAIRQTLGQGHTILSLQRSLNNYYPSQMDSLYYAEDVLNISYNQSLDNILAEVRQKDNSQQVVFASVIKKHLENCCDNSGEVFQYLQKAGFRVFDRTDEMKKHDPNLSYNRIITAYKTTTWQTLLGMFGWEYDQTMITIYYEDRKIEWVYAHIQRHGG